jgi:hypothetical protein
MCLRRGHWWYEVGRGRRSGGRRRKHEWYLLVQWDSCKGRLRRERRRRRLNVR